MLLVLDCALQTYKPEFGTLYIDIVRIYAFML